MRVALKEWFFSLAFLSAGVAAYGGFFYLPGSGSEDWPQVPGEVLDCTVERQTSDDDVDYLVKLRYRYRVGSNHHNGFRIAYWGAPIRFSWRRFAEALCDEYPAGLAVTVSYEPAFPPNSALEPGGHPLGGPLTYGGAGLAVLFLLLAMGAAVVEAVQGKRERDRLQRELGPD